MLIFLQGVNGDYVETKCAYLFLYVFCAFFQASFHDWTYLEKKLYPIQFAQTSIFTRLLDIAHGFTQISLGFQLIVPVQIKVDIPILELCFLIMVRNFMLDDEHLFGNLYFLPINGEDVCFIAF